MNPTGQGGTAHALRLDVLGAGPAFTDRIGSAGAAYLVRSGGDSLLLDLGQGAFPRLAATIEPSSLSAVLVSHLHPDHFVDLVPLRHYLRYDLQPPRRVRVIGPAGLADRLDALHGQPGFCAESFEMHPIPMGIQTIGPFRIGSRPVAHSAESYAFRVSVGNGPGLVYSGDSASIDDLSPLVSEGDTLLVEVSFGIGSVPPGAMHFNAAMVSALIERTRPGHVLLTHILRGSDRAATVAAVQDGYDGLVELVAPGFQTTVRPQESQGPERG